MWNAKNPNQGTDTRVLAVCSAGLLRSPTVAWILSNEPYNFNTRAAGLDQGHALIYADDVLLEWADVVVCMDEYQEKVLKERTMRPVHNLKIGDNFNFKDKGLIHIAKMRLAEVFK